MEPLLRAAPLTPARESIQKSGSYFLILQTSSPEGWLLNSWGGEPRKGLDCRKTNSASQGKSIFSRIQPDLEACRAGRTQRDNGRWVLGDTGHSATLQWRSTRSSWVCSSPWKRELIHGSGFSKVDTPVGWRTGKDGGGELKEGEEGLRLWSLHALGELGSIPAAHRALTDEGNPWHACFSEVDSNCIFLFYGFLDPGSLFQNLCTHTITDEVQRARALIIQSKTCAHYVGTSDRMHCMGAWSSPCTAQGSRSQGEEG